MKDKCWKTGGFRAPPIPFFDASRSSLVPFEAAAATFWDRLAKQKTAILSTSAHKKKEKDVIMLEYKEAEIKNKNEFNK